MAVRIEKSENGMTAYIQGEIDHHSAKEIREAIEAGRYKEYKEEKLRRMAEGE